MVESELDGTECCVWALVPLITLYETVEPACAACLQPTGPPEDGSSALPPGPPKKRNCPMSTWWVILMPVAVYMDRGWSDLHICIIRRDPEAMAGTLGRDGRLYGAISADLEPRLESSNC